MDFAALERFFADQILSTEHRALSLVHGDPASAPMLLLQRAHISEGICQDSVARLTCFTTHVGLDVNAFIGTHVAVSLITDRGTRRLFPMVIQHAERGRSDGALTAVHLIGRDPLALMDKRHYRVFHDLGALDVVCEVLGNWIKSHPGTSMRYSMLGIDRDQHPPRANIIQFAHETDAEFVRRLLRSMGIAWFWRPLVKQDPRFDGAVPLLELVMFGASVALPPSSSPMVRYHRRDGTEESDTIDLLSEGWELAPSRTTLKSWDYKSAKMTRSTGVAGTLRSRVYGLDYGDAGQAWAQALSQEHLCAPHLGDDPDDLDRLAQARADHDTFRSHGFRGRGNDRTMAPGAWKIVDGYAPFDGRLPNDRRLVVTQVESFTQSNLPGELYEPAQALMEDFGVPDWAWADDARNAGKSRTEPFTCRFSAVPFGTPIRPAPPAACSPRIVTGIVRSDAGEINCDALTRVHVRLPGAQPNADTVRFLRTLTPWGGDNHGMLAIPRAGTEVALLVFDFDRLLILGSLPNGANAPARPSHMPSLPANRSQTFVLGRELGGKRQQHLLIDDFPGQLMTQLASEAGASTLSLGELTTPRRDGQAQPRGNGFELASQHHGAIRTALRMLLSAWGHSGDQLRAPQHDRMAQSALDLVRALGQYAAQHRGLALDDAPLAALVAAILAPPDLRDPTLDGAEPTISITAPAGVATTTPKTLLNYAGTNIDSVAQQHLNLSAGQRFNLNAGRGIGLFAHHDGLSAIAHNGPLTLQAQHDSVRVDAANDIRWTAVGGNLVGSAQEIHLVAADGSFVKIGGGGITLGTSGSILQKSAGFRHQGPATMSAEPPSFGAGNADQRFVLGITGMDGPATAHAHYEITLSDGSVVSGVSDAQGRTDLLQRDAMHIAGLRIQKKGA